MKISEAMTSARMKRVATAHLGTAKQCKAIRSTGERCKRKTIKGGTVCMWHGGNFQRKRIAKEQTEERIRRVLGVPLEVDPTTALLEQVHEAAGNVAILREMVQDLEEMPIMDGVWARAIYGPSHTGDMAPHVLVKLYNEERDRLAKIAKLAVDSGIAERQVRIAEQQGEMIVKVILLVLTDDRLGLSEKKQVIGRQVASEHLRMIAARAPSDYEDEGV